MDWDGEDYRELPAATDFHLSPPASWELADPRHSIRQYPGPNLNDIQDKAHRSLTMGQRVFGIGGRGLGMGCLIQLFRTGLRAQLALALLLGLGWSSSGDAEALS